MDSFTIGQWDCLYLYYIVHCTYLCRELSHLHPDNIFGFLINSPSRMSVMFVPLPYHGKHWTAVRRVGDTYYELDSKCSEPLVIGKTDGDVLNFLAGRLNGDDAKTELLLVLTAEAFQAVSWKHSSDSSSNEQSGKS